MDPKHKDLLREHRVQLVESLEATDILPYLRQENVITDNESEKISKGKTQRERCQYLLNLLPKRGPHAFEVFRNALIQTRYEHLNELINREDVQDERLQARELDSHLRCQCRIFTDSLFGESKLVDIVRAHCCLILENIEANDLIDFIYQQHTIGHHEYDQVQTASTRLERIQELLKILINGDTEDVDIIFLSALKERRKYEFISNKIECPTNVKQTQKETSGDLTGKICHQNNDTTKANRVLPYQTVDVGRPPGSVKQFTRANKYIDAVFLHLGKLFNQGNFNEYRRLSGDLVQMFPTDADLTCVLAYYNSSIHVFEKDYDRALDDIDGALTGYMPRTANPAYSTLELLGAKTRIHVETKELGTLEDILDDAKQLLNIDPVGCKGKLAGWIYMGDVKAKMSRMSLLNLNIPAHVTLYETLFSEAKKNCCFALYHFNEDVSKDPFGFCLSLVRLAILLLRCGGNGMTMTVQYPSEEDITKAGKYIETFENLPFDMIHIGLLAYHFYIAKCDYHYRRGNIIRALEFARLAEKLTTEQNMQEYCTHARNRCVYLNTRCRSGIPAIQDVTLTHPEIEDILKEAISEGVKKSH